MLKKVSFPCLFSVKQDFSMVFVNFYHNYNFFYLKYTFFVIKLRFYPLDSIDLNYLRASGRHFYPIQRIGIFIRWIALSKLRAMQFLHWIKFIRLIATYPLDSDLSVG